MKRIFAACLAVSCCTSAFTARADEPSFTLAQALERAGATSPAIESGAAGVLAAQAARSVAGLRPNPELNIQTENVAGSGDYRGFRSAETTAQVTLPLELGGKRPARVALANAQQDRAQIEQAVIVADLRLAVTQAYVTAVSAAERASVAQRQVAIAAEALRAAQARVRAGRASPLEAQRAELAHLNAQATQEQAERLANVARANLGRLIGGPVAGTLDLRWFETLAVAGPVDRAAVSDMLTARAAALDVATADAQVRLAGAQRVPDLQLFAGPRRLSGSNDTAMLMGINIPLQIFDNGGAAQAQARAERQRADATRRMTEIQLDQAIASADAEVANAEIAARIASGPALAAAQEAARIARIGYREGRFGQIDLIEAERALLDTRMAAIDALATYHDASARRDRLVAPASLFAKD
ncbi:cobalt-zinc-cadmium efflux system outer membrane protein [Sphingobium xenophagum]|uniref:Cobalt-zinc-cadmium efflux system outer membrane protein n=1 Tax=Sphingobium xenophagum TaxID=121428 RepID=A0ABU1X079_SPHXE|nr:TolC family protein [Sphingobium xenophagum]MDR7154980.1 cobalt-zinc-cadmium efflux system outer membrane protein [Sphingobium xenophagum]